MDLKPLREKIDILDKALVKLLNERAALALEVGSLKAKMGKESAYDAGREKDVIAHVLAENKGPFPNEDLEILFRTIMLSCRNLEEHLKV